MTGFWCAGEDVGVHGCVGGCVHGWVGVWGWGGGLVQRLMMDVREQHSSPTTSLRS